MWCLRENLMFVFGIIYRKLEPTKNPQRNNLRMQGVLKFHPMVSCLLLCEVCWRFFPSKRVSCNLENDSEWRTTTTRWWRTFKNREPISDKNASLIITDFEYRLIWISSNLPVTLNIRLTFGSVFFIENVVLIISRYYAIYSEWKIKPPFFLSFFLIARFLEESNFFKAVLNIQPKA